MFTEKANAICALKILQEYSDEKHILSTKEIIQKLYLLYDMRVDRRTIYSAMSLLTDLDYDISTYDENKQGWYLRERDFEASEIALLADAVYSFPFISENQSRKLMDKLQKTQSCHQRRNYTHLKVMRSGGKTANRQVFLSIEILDEAIEQNRKVSFTYLKYDISKILVPRRKEKYIVSPYDMVFCNEHYYLICTMEGKDDTGLYRIDRMRDIEICNEERETVNRNFAPEKKVTNAVYAFMGKPERILMLCENNVLDDIIDKFGNDIHVQKEDDDHLKVSLLASAEGMQFWALQYLSCVEILEPISLRKGITESLKNNPYIQ